MVGWVGSVGHKITNCKTTPKGAPNKSIINIFIRSTSCLHVRTMFHVYDSPKIWFSLEVGYIFALYTQTDSWSHEPYKFTTLLFISNYSP